METPSVQLGPTSVTGRLFSRSQWTIYGNGSEAFEWNKSRSLSLAVQQSGWNPVGLNVKQMCPINLRRSPSSLMKTNVRAASGTIHPAGFPPVPLLSCCCCLKIRPCLFTSYSGQRSVYNFRRGHSGLHCTTLLQRAVTRLPTFFIFLFPNFRVRTPGYSKNNVGISVGKSCLEQKAAQGKCLIDR